MEPKEKAKKLVNRFAKEIDETHRDDLPKRVTKAKAKQCALITVEEILEVLPKQDEFGIVSQHYQFMQSVKTEIKSL